jgi:hypothetical protein
MNHPRLFLGAGISAMVLMLFTSQGSAQTAVPPAEAPLGKAADNKIYAQQLVNDLLAANGDLLAVGFHALPPGGTEYMIVAHSRDLISKKDSEADVEMIKNDQTIIGPETTGYTTMPRMVVHAALRDSAGRIVGLAVFSFKLETGTTKLATHARAEAMLDGLARKISNSAALFNKSAP